MAKGNQLARLLREKYAQGVEHGFASYSCINLIGGYNIADKHFESDGAYFAFFRDLEQECARIFWEECKSDAENAPLAVLHYVDELRKRGAMEPLNGGVND